MKPKNFRTKLCISFVNVPVGDDLLGIIYKIASAFCNVFIKWIRSALKCQKMPSQTSLLSPLSVYIRNILLQNLYYKV